MAEDINIIERLARVEEKIDSLIDNSKAALVRDNDHEMRIRSLESHGAKMIGIGTILAMITGIVGTRVFEVSIGH